MKNAYSISKIFIPILLSCICLEAVAQVSNELCKEFKAYVERQGNRPLCKGLLPDPEFKDFDLPKLQPAPKGLGERLWIQAVAVSKWVPEPLDVRKMQSALDNINEVSDVVSFSTGRYDVDNDGEIDNYLVTYFPHHCKSRDLISARVTLFNDKNNLRFEFLEDKFTDGYPVIRGLTFLYKGKIHVVTGTPRRYTVSSVGLVKVVGDPLRFCSITPAASQNN